MMAQSLRGSYRRKYIKPIIFMFMCLCMCIPFVSYLTDTDNLAKEFKAYDDKQTMMKVHTMTVERFYDYRLGWSFSKLGEILFHRGQIPDPNPNANRKFVVLVWKYWNWLKQRHVLNYGKRDRKDDILEGCSVNNCIFSGNDSLIDTADAVLIHLQRGLVPTVKHRNPKQRWVFLSDETPRNAFSLAKETPRLDSFYNIFNWSMTYRSDADVPVPYGRTLLLEQPVVSEYSQTLQEIVKLVPNWHRKKRSLRAAVLMSNCKEKKRNEFLNKLKKHVDIHVYGDCSDDENFKNSCPGHFRADCDPIADYLFYLVLENSRCNQYLTEKVFYNAYSKGAVPIIFGTSIEDVEALLPPYSYIYADEETNIEQLANDINVLAQNPDLLAELHMWRNHFKIVNEHGYFGTKSYHLCRLCEALNYNDDSVKVYDKDSLDFFLDPSISCADEKNLNIKTNKLL